MKKNELAKKSRKLLSAILTGTVLITSVVPESLIQCVVKPLALATGI